MSFDQATDMLLQAQPKKKAPANKKAWAMYYRCRQFMIERPAAFMLLLGAALIAGPVLFEYSYELARERLVDRPDVSLLLAAEWIAALRNAHREVWYEVVVFAIMGSGAIAFAIGSLLALACRRLGNRVC